VTFSVILLAQGLCTGLAVLDLTFLNLIEILTAANSSSPLNHAWINAILILIGLIALFGYLAFVVSISLRISRGGSTNSDSHPPPSYSLLPSAPEQEQKKSL
jgi:hypothetical protein